MALTRTSILKRINMKKFGFTKTLNLMAFIVCTLCSLVQFFAGNPGLGFFNLSLALMNLFFLLIPD